MHCLYPLQSSSDAQEHRIIPSLWPGELPSRRADLFLTAPPLAACGQERLRVAAEPAEGGLYLIVTFKPSNSQNGHSSVICFSRSTFILGGSKRKAPLLFSLHLLYPLKAESVPNRHRIIPSLWPGELPSRRADPFPKPSRRAPPMRVGSRLRPPPPAR